MTDDSSGDGPTVEPVPVDPVGQLQYAPPVRSASPFRPAAAVVAGAFTSALAIGLVYLIDRYQHADPFGWQLTYLIPIGIPVGAILISVVASIGYMLGFRLAHVRPGWGLVTVVVLLMVATYVGGLYAEYAPYHWVNRRTGLPVSFLEYVDRVSSSWTWKTHGEVHKLGRFGYVYMVMNVATFIIVGLIVCAVGQSAAYCNLCRVYLTRRRLGLFPASTPYRNLSKLTSEGRAEFQAEQQAHMQSALELGQLLMTLAEAGDVDGIRQAIAGVHADRRSIARLPSRLALEIDTCPGCRTTNLTTVMLIGKTVRTLDRRAVSGAFADLLGSGRPDVDPTPSVGSASIGN